MDRWTFAADRDTGDQGEAQQKNLAERDADGKHEPSFRPIADLNRRDRLGNPSAFRAGEETAL